MNIYGKIVYLAAPVKIGDRQANIKRAITTAGYLIESGAFVYSPFLPLFQEYMMRDPTFWQQFGQTFLERSDVLIWLEGESEKVEREIEYAKDIGIDVLPYTIFLQ